MKKVFASLLFALCVLVIVDVMIEPFLPAQTPGTFQFSAISPLPPKPIPNFAKVKFVVVTSTNAKCYECGEVYAVACAPSFPDCGVPDKLVIESDYFETVDAAVKFLEDNQNKDFVKLFSLTGVVVNLTEVKETIKQLHVDSVSLVAEAVDPYCGYFIDKEDIRMRDTQNDDTQG